MSVILPPFLSRFSPFVHRTDAFRRLGCLSTPGTLSSSPSYTHTMRVLKLVSTSLLLIRVFETLILGSACSNKPADTRIFSENVSTLCQLEYATTHGCAYSPPAFDGHAPLLEDMPITALVSRMLHFVGFPSLITHSYHCRRSIVKVMIGNFLYLAWWHVFDANDPLTVFKRRESRE